MNDTLPEYIDIAKRLLAVRKSLKLTQAAFAARNGFNSTQYNNWEKGSRRIPIEKALKLCDRYGLTLDFIYRGREDGLSENAKNLASSQ